MHESVIQEDDLVLDRGGVTEQAHDQLVGGLQVSVNEIDIVSLSSKPNKEISTVPSCNGFF